MSGELLVIATPAERPPLVHRVERVDNDISASDRQAFAQQGLAGQLKQVRLRRSRDLPS